MDSSVKGLSAKVLREFGLGTGTGNVRRDKTGYLCHTDEGTVIVQKPRTDKDTLLYAHYVKEGLYSAGFHETDRFLPAENGMPFCEVSGEVYIASKYRWGNGFRELRFDDVKSVAAAACAAGRLHSITSAKGFFDGFSGNVPKNKDYAAFTTADGFERQRKTMQGYKKIAKRQSRLSDFDVKFLKSYDYYEQLDSRVSELLAGSGGSIPFASNFSHNLLKEETLLTNGGIIYVTCFDSCSGDSFLFDLASVLKRFLRMAKRPAASDLEAIIEAYSRVNPLGGSEFKALNAILLYPDKFIKTLVKYYSKKRSWIPASFAAALDGINEQDNTALRLVDEFFSD